MMPPPPAPPNSWHFAEPFFLTTTQLQHNTKENSKESNYKC